jgi:formylglycine-generating enzyme required for sulfatase activity
MTKRSLGLLGLAAFALSAGAQDKVEPKDRILRLFLDEFIAVTPGTGQFPASFKMGTDDGPDSEKPVREVKFKQPFKMAKYEMTQELYEAIMGKNPSRWPGPRNSVEKISWHEATEFCKKATDAMRERKLLTAEETIRLPTEAEWEYVCRAGTTTPYSFGDKVADLGEYGWFTGNAKGNDPPVGKKKANPWGFYDMHGYIWEWVQDAWQPTYEGAPTDGSARDAKDAKERVGRGGAWTEKAENCRSATRGHWPADTRSDAIGFRCVLEKTGK